MTVHLVYSLFFFFTLWTCCIIITIYILGSHFLLSHLFSINSILQELHLFLFSLVIHFENSCWCSFVSFSLINNSVCLVVLNALIHSIFELKCHIHKLQFLHVHHIHPFHFHFSCFDAVYQFVRCFLDITTAS